MLYENIKTLAKRRHWSYSVRKIDGVQVHSLSTAGAADDQVAGKGADEPDGAVRYKALKQLGSRIGKHFYWTEDGDFLIFGKLPQSLADRAAAKLDTPLAGWLAAHHYAGAHSLLGFTATTRDAQRSSYYSYLQMLQMAADRGRSFRRRGGSLGHARRACSQPPAQRRGRRQPQRHRGHAFAASELRTAAAGVARCRQQRHHGGGDDGGDGGHRHSCLSDDGRILVHFGTAPPHHANQAIAGKTLTLRPSASAGTRWSWTCQADGIADKYLPAQCKNPH